MMLRRELGLAFAALVTAVVSGCAPMAIKPGLVAAGALPSSTAPGPAAAGGASAGTSSPVVPAGAVMDTTTPSADAQRVLARIPEPLTPAQQALNPSQDTSRARGTAVAPAAAYDSLQAAPVPEATQPLGTEASTVTMADSTSVAPSASGVGGAPAASGASSGAAATGAAAGAAAGASAASAGSPAATSAAGGKNGPCWRLQVGAPLESEKEKADGRREAAQSLLMAPFTIVPEKGYLKVRTSDCMSRDAADALKKRAVDSGFDDAFLIDTNAAPAAAPATKHQRVPASKRKK